jgi:hypothetical protein
MKGKSLPADLTSYGATVTLAIEKTEGDVICFLDDDDMYSPWRLEVIRDRFKHNPSLTYYHNNVLVERKTTHTNNRSMWSVDRIADEVYRLLERASREKPADIPTWSDVARVYEERLYKG